MTEQIQKDIDDLDIQALVKKRTYTDHKSSKVFKPTLMRPKKTVWVRAHPEWSLGPVDMLDDEGTYYILGPDVEGAVSSNDVKKALLVPAITQSGNIFLWPVIDDNNSWAVSMFDVVEAAKKSWVRIYSDRDQGEYLYHQPVSEVQ